MSDTATLKAMLDNLINGKPEQAQMVFHSYLKDKIHDVFDVKPERVNQASEKPDSDNI